MAEDLDHAHVDAVDHVHGGLFGRSAVLVAQAAVLPGKALGEPLIAVVTVRLTATLAGVDAVWSPSAAGGDQVGIAALDRLACNMRLAQLRHHPAELSSPRG